MRLILVVLLLALIFAELGFAIHVLWIIAAVLFVVWLVGFALGKVRKSAHAVVTVVFLGRTGHRQ